MGKNDVSEGNKSENDGSERKPWQKKVSWHAGINSTFVVFGFSVVLAAIYEVTGIHRFEEYALVLISFWCIVLLNRGIQKMIFKRKFRPTREPAMIASMCIGVYFFWTGKPEWTALLFFLNLIAAVLDVAPQNDPDIVKNDETEQNTACFY